jgi:hypothetical protein
MRDILKDLIRDRIDRALCLPRTGPSGDEPAPHEVLHRPGKDAKPTLKKRRGQGKKTGKELKELGNITTDALRMAGKSATTDGKWTASKSGTVRVRGGE